MSRNKPVTKLAVVDIETLDKTPNAIIFAIGCVVIDIQQLEIVNEFYTVVNPNQKGRTAGNGTPEWWLKQSVESPEAFKQLQASYGVSKTLEFVLRDFELFLIEEFGAEKVNMFGNGPEFDNVILDDAFAWAGLKTPWPYLGNQSIRTSNLLMQIAGVKSDREFVGIKHHALDDAYHEAFLLIDALKQFNKQFKPAEKSINCDVDEAGTSVLYAALGAEVVKTLDEVCSGWRNQGQDFKRSAVDKINQMALAIDMCDLEKHSGEYQAAHSYMNTIFTKLRSHDVDVKTYRQCASAVDKLLFERQSFIEKSHCFDELQAILRKANPDSFERECASSLLDDCKHAIDELAEYKSKYMVLKSKHL